MFESCTARHAQPGGFAPPDPPAASLARRFAASLRLAGSFAALTRLRSGHTQPGGFAPPDRREIVASGEYLRAIIVRFEVP